MLRYNQKEEREVMSMKRVRVEFWCEALELAKKAIDAVIYQDSYVGYVVEYVPA